MSEDENLEYLYGLERFGIQPRLDVMEQLMEALGHPEKSFASVHVTGTNGKGSTCAMIESVLRHAGYKTGLYTSPHLYTFHERIRVAGIPISEEDLSSLVHEIRSVIERERIIPTFFEFTTALCFLYFSRASLDIAIIEVGMGGRYDATNVVTPLVSVITNIGLDHTEYLGPTTRDIAHEKAGIIKEGVPAITAEVEDDILAIFDEEAIGKHTAVRRVQDMVQTKALSSTFSGQEVEVYIPSLFQIYLPLLGRHQLENMATAIATVCIMKEQGYAISDEDIQEGIANTVWEGRLQIVSRDPLVIVDGAHNGNGVRALSLFLQDVPSYDVLVVATKKGKDVSEMCEMIIPLFSSVVVTEGVYMPERAEVLANRISSVHKDVYVEPEVERAVAKATALVPKGGTIVVTGSLYMIPQALTYLKNI